MAAHTIESIPLKNIPFSQWSKLHGQFFPSKKALTALAKDLLDRPVPPQADLSKLVETVSGDKPLTTVKDLEEKLETHGDLKELRRAIVDLDRIIPTPLSHLLLHRREVLRRSDDILLRAPLAEFAKRKNLRHPVSSLLSLVEAVVAQNSSQTGVELALELSSSQIFQLAPLAMELLSQLYSLPVDSPSSSSSPSSIATEPASSPASQPAPPLTPFAEPSGNPISLTSTLCAEAGRTPSSTSIPFFSSSDPRIFQMLPASKLQPSLYAYVLRFQARDCTLRSLDLSHRKLGDEEVNAIAQLLKENTSLTELNLSSNFITIEGARAIAESFNRGSSIEVINFANNPGLSRSEVQSLFRSRCPSIRVSSPPSIVILCTHFEELQAVRNVFSQQPSFSRMQYEGNLFFQTTIIDSFGKTFIITLAHMPDSGSEKALIYTNLLLKKFDPQIFVMTGVCAGRPGMVELGDVVVAKKVFAIEGKKGTETQSITISTQSSFDRMITHFGDVSAGDWWKWIICPFPLLSGEASPLPSTSSASSSSQDKRPTAHCLPFAVSLGFFRADNPWEDLSKLESNVGAIDMEGTGMYKSVISHNEITHSQTEVLLVKGVANFANGESHDHFKQYSAQAAASWSLEFLMQNASLLLQLEGPC